MSTSQLLMPVGAPLDVTVEDVRVADTRVEVDLVIDGAEWSVVEGGLLFHLSDTVESDGLPPLVALDAPVTLSVRLDDALVSSALTAEDIEIRLGSADDTDVLRRTESWYATRVRQGGIDHATWFAAAERVGGESAADDSVMSVEFGDDWTQTEMPRLLAMADSVLRDVELEPERLGPELLHAGIEGEDGRYHLLVHTRDRDHQLLVYATSEIVVADDRRASVMELITRINPSLTGTWFEMDLDAGTVSARCSLLLEGIRLEDDTFVENVLSAAIETMERYLPAITAVALEGFEPDDFPEPDDG
jgi:hypothetical protein